MNGWLCIDKTEGFSSNFILMKIKKNLQDILKQKIKVGFVGTLDPFASGVLPIAINDATKFIPYLRSQKEYFFKVKFGKETDTFDKTGKVINISDKIPTKHAILDIIPRFLGKIFQMPPRYSALKINGRRACDIIRSGKDVILKKREIQIYDLTLLKFENNEAEFVTKVSSGTYIRSLAIDIAKSVNSLCYVEELKRLQSGFFLLNHSITLENLQKIKHTNELLCEIMQIDSPLDDIPAYYLQEDRVTKMRNGLSTTLISDKFKIGDILRIYNTQNFEFIGLGEISQGLELIPRKLCSY